MTYFKRPQALVEAPGQLQLRYAEPAAEMVGQLLQRPERAQPAAERPAAPEQQPGRHGEPEDEDQRVHEKIGPAEVGEQRVGEGQHVDHRQLRLGVPAEPDQGEDEKAVADPGGQPRPADEPVLEEEQAGQQQRGRQQHADVEHAPAPDPLQQHLPGAVVGEARLADRRHVVRGHRGATGGRRQRA